MKKLLIITATLATLTAQADSPYWETVTPDSNTIIQSDGSVSVRSGNAVIHDDGSTSFINGNEIYHTPSVGAGGSYSVEHNGTVYHDNGSVSQRIDSDSYTANDSRCITVGDTTSCY